MLKQLLENEDYKKKKRPSVRPSVGPSRGPQGVVYWTVTGGHMV